MSSARRIVTVSASVLMSVAVWTAPASAGHGTGLHWGGTGVRTVVLLDKTGDTAWQQILDRAVNTWNGGLRNVHLVHRLGSGPCGMSGGDMEACLGGTSAGVAHWSYSPSTRHLGGATISLNVSATRYGDALACHEIGHSLGLGHRSSNETGSCMTASVSPEQTRPDQHDFDTVFAQTNHTG